jgi:hypothetical protein
MQTCRKTEWLVSVVLAVIALMVPVPASAGPATDAGLPTSVAPPPAGNGVPNSSASVAGAPGAVDLASQGYVEEEFIVSGAANVYRYGADRAVEVDREGV